MIQSDDLNSSDWLWYSCNDMLPRGRSILFGNKDKLPMHLSLSEHQEFISQATAQIEQKLSPERSVVIYYFIEDSRIVVYDAYFAKRGNVAPQSWYERMMDLEKIGVDSAENTESNAVHVEIFSSYQESFSGKSVYLRGVSQPVSGDITNPDFIYAGSLTVQNLLYRDNCLWRPMAFSSECVFEDALGILSVLEEGVRHNIFMSDSKTPVGILDSNGKTLGF